MSKTIAAKINCGFLDPPDLQLLNDNNFVFFFGLAIKILGIWGLKGLKNAFSTVYYMPWNV